MDVLDGLRAFVATAQTGSFTAAAERLGISNRLTSKYVAELEARLGTRLLQRTTRRVGVTAAGEDLLARAPAVLDEFDDMLTMLREEKRGLGGVIRVSAPVTFGEIYVADLLDRFAAVHPDLVIDLRLSDAYADLAAEGIDLAFRIGTLEPSSIMVRKLGEIRSHVVASPDYLARHGTPARPADLAAHRLIADTNRKNPGRWTFRSEEIAVEGAFRVNSARVARDLAVAGRGIANCPDFVLTEALQSGALVPVLTEDEGPRIPFSAVYLPGRILPRAVRALIDFAVSSAGDHAIPAP